MMRSVAWLALVLWLPLVAGASTNEWERRAAEAPRSQAVKLYARAIRDYGKTRPPDVAGSARCLDNLPWGEADPREFKQLARTLAPLLEKKHTKPEFETWKRRILTKYRLVRKKDEPDIAAPEAGYDVPVVQVAVLAAPATTIAAIEVPETTVNGVRVRRTSVNQVGVPETGVELLETPQTWIEAREIPVLAPRGVRLAVVDPDTTRIELAEIPENTIVLVRVDDSVSESIREWAAVNELRFGIMGEHGLFEPHRYSVLGFQYEELRQRIEEAGPYWRKDPLLLAGWEAYWRSVRTALDRRERLHRRGYDGR